MRRRLSWRFFTTMPFPNPRAHCKSPGRTGSGLTSRQTGYDRAPLAPVAPYRQWSSCCRRYRDAAPHLMHQLSGYGHRPVSRGLGWDMQLVKLIHLWMITCLEKTLRCLIHRSLLLGAAETENFWIVLRGRQRCALDLHVLVILPNNL